MSFFTLPSPFASIPREPLLYPHSSPIEPLNRLTSALSSSSPKTKYWIKREDSNSGLAFGGNKVRKLEYVLSDALKNGATTLVTTGVLQSNHMRQVAAVAAKHGLKAHLLPNDHVSPDFPEYKTLGNVQIMHLLSATLSPHDSKADVEKVLSTLRSQGEIPYWIPSGASIHPLGGLGYARFAFELAHQENELGVFFDTIILPCAAGSTLAGIITGFKLIQKLTKDSADEEEEKGRRIIGIDVFANWPEQSRAQILSIARNTGSLIGLGDEDIRECDVVVDDRWNGGKYGVLNRETKDAVKMLAGLEGILTDPVYTGKAMAALIGKARKGEFEGSRNVLFVHTGGVPILSAYPDLM